MTKTDSVVNVFTYGDINITLKETTGENYKMVPGNTIAKDPKIIVLKDSEDCYLFVKVVNGISGIEVATDDGVTITEQLTAKGWINLTGDIWYYNTKVTLSDADQKIPVFDSFTLKDDADVTGYATLDNDNSKIVITAYAIQSNGFTSKGTLLENVTDAWTASGWS
jgi:hypothetical protein